MMWRRYLFLSVISELAHGALPPPQTEPEFARLFAEGVLHINETLLNYFVPPVGQITTDIRRNWLPWTDKCVAHSDCWCFHVKGSPSKAENPDGWKQCEKLRMMNLGHGKRDKEHSLGVCNSKYERTCSYPCVSGKNGAPCLFSEMAPVKLLAVIMVARAAGVTHIIEEGRKGGLSAYLYHKHGFGVTSIEYLPNRDATLALETFAPDIRLMDGDGAQLVPQRARELAPRERVLVIFDGEKRMAAYRTYSKCKQDVAVAVFDDSQYKYSTFKQTLDANGEVWWTTEGDRTYQELHDKELQYITFFNGSTSGMMNEYHKKMVQGNLEVVHFAMVKGGAWQ